MLEEEQRSKYNVIAVDIHYVKVLARVNLGVLEPDVSAPIDSGPRTLGC